MRLLPLAYHKNKLHTICILATFKLIKRYGLEDCYLHSQRSVFFFRKRFLLSSWIKRKRWTAPPARVWHVWGAWPDRIRIQPYNPAIQSSHTIQPYNPAIQSSHTIQPYNPTIQSNHTIQPHLFSSRLFRASALTTFPVCLQYDNTIQFQKYSQNC